MTRTGALSITNLVTADMKIGLRSPETSVSPILYDGVEVGWVRFDHDLEGYVFECGDSNLRDIYRPYCSSDMFDHEAVLATVEKVLRQNPEFFSGWLSRAQIEIRESECGQ